MRARRWASARERPERMRSSARWTMCARSSSSISRSRRERRKSVAARVRIVVKTFICLPLLVTQGDHGIDLHGAMSGDVGGGEGDGSEQDDGADISERVERRDAGEEIAGEARDGEGQKHSREQSHADD